LQKVADVPYTLFDLSQKTDQEIIDFYGQAIGLCTGLLALKHAHDADLIPVFGQVLDLFNQQPTSMQIESPERVEQEIEARKAVFTYLLELVKQQEEYDRVIDYIRNKKQSTEGMGYFSQVLAKEREKGIEQRSTDIAKLMLKDGKPIGEIIRYTGLSEVEIEQLRAHS